MNRIVTYLLFNGNCREVMQFYQQCLGGRLELITLADSESGYEFPDNMKDLVLQARLTHGELVLLGSDLTGHLLSYGNHINLFIESDEQQELNQLFDKLSEEGTIDTPLEKSHFGELTGSLTDKYGNHWLFQSKPETKIIHKLKI